MTDKQNQDRPVIIWRFSDGKPGHDKQSLGLVQALAELIPCETYTIIPPKTSTSLLGLLTRSFPAEGLPVPDLFIGAGHKTHVAMLAAKHTYSGKVIVLMKPSLPIGLFDCCLIPEHDKPPKKDNIILTCGALNQIKPGQSHKKDQGIILVGGPSRHFGWDDKITVQQIVEIIDRNDGVRWVITNSRRTPKLTNEHLREVCNDAADFKPHEQCPPGWLEQQLEQAECAWVTEDSVSMIYEVLTANIKAGLLPVRKIRHNKLTESINKLIKQNMIVGYNDWLAGTTLAPPSTQLNEAQRCARLIKERFIQQK